MLNCQSGAWKRQGGINAFESIDLSGISDTGPDNLCTSVLKTKIRSYVYDAPSDSLLILDGQIQTANVDGSRGAICLMINDVLCGAQSQNDRYASASASCIIPVTKGRNTIRIVGVHNVGISRFRVGFAAFPL